MILYEKEDKPSLKGLQHHVGTVSEAAAALTLINMHGIHKNNEETLNKADKAYQSSANHLPDEDLDNRTEHGVQMAHVITHHLKEKHPDYNVHEVHLTTKNGDIAKATGGKHSDDNVSNPSDLTIGLKHKKIGHVIYHGISLKSSEGGDIGFKNPSPKHMDEALGTNAEKMHKEAHESFAKTNKIAHLPDKSLSGNDKKSAIANTPGLKEKANKHYGEAFNKIRDHIVNKVSDHLKSDEGQEKVKHFYASKYVNSDTKPGYMPYSKVTAMGNTKKGVAVKVDEPEHSLAGSLLKDKKTKLTVHPAGNGYIHVIAHHPDHDAPIHLFSEQVKTSSGVGYSTGRHNIQPGGKKTTVGMKNITRN